MIIYNPHKVVLGVNDPSYYVNNCITILRNRGLQYKNWDALESREIKLCGHVCAGHTDHLRCCKCRKVVKCRVCEIR